MTILKMTTVTSSEYENRTSGNNNYKTIIVKITMEVFLNCDYIRTHSIMFNDHTYHFVVQ